MTDSRKSGSTRKRAAHTNEHDDSTAVAAYLAVLEHPLKPVLEVIRAAIIEADPAITEGIKWNSPSFYCHGWFVTVGVRASSGVQVVMHHGAKVRADAALGQTIRDPSALLKWLSADRAVVSFTSEEDFSRKRAAFVALIRQWAAYQAHLAKTAEPGAAADGGA